MHRSRVRPALLAVALLASCGCGEYRMAQMNYRRCVTALNSPLTFAIAEDSTSAAWERARVFVSQYGSVPIESSTDSLIQTGPLTEWPQYGYTITRSRMGSGVQITVRCNASRKREQGTDNNAHIAAYYIRTGILDCRDFTSVGIRRSP